MAGPGRFVWEGAPAPAPDTDDQVFHGACVGHARRPLETATPGRISARTPALPARGRGVFRAFPETQGRAPLAQMAGNQRTVEVIRTEEKGSDVNLAVRLLNDGWLDA